MAGDRMRVLIESCDSINPEDNPATHDGMPIILVYRLEPFRFKTGLIYGRVGKSTDFTVHVPFKVFNDSENQLCFRIFSEGALMEDREGF